MAGENNKHHWPYARLTVMVALSFAAMYILMYAMVNNFANVFNNANRVYMAGLMTAPMVVIELLLMRQMYPNRRLNSVTCAASVSALFVFFVLIRQQFLVRDDQFLRSMIPHHAGAILMCEKASIQAGDIKELCQNIISSQQSEIERMKAMLNR